MRYIIYYIVISMFVGCTSLKNDKIKSYNVDCSDCKIKMKLDITDNDDRLELKGF